MSSLCGRVSRKAVVGFCAHEAGEAPAAVPWQARWETMRREQKRAGWGGSEVGVWLVFRMFSWGTAGPLNSLHSPLFRQWLFLPCCLSHHKWTQEPRATSARMESALPTLPENNLQIATSPLWTERGLVQASPPPRLAEASLWVPPEPAVQPASIVLRPKGDCRQCLHLPYRWAFLEGSSPTSSAVCSTQQIMLHDETAVGQMNNEPCP